MTDTLTFAQATKMARKVAKDVPPARLWNMLSTKVRNGEDISDFFTMALIAAVVGKRNASQYAATVISVWGSK